MTKELLVGHSAIRRVYKSPLFHHGGVLLLADASLELKEVAFLLGDEHANSYFRAFRQGQKILPCEWRHRYG